MVATDCDQTGIAPRPNPATVAKRIGTKVTLPPASTLHDWVDLLDTSEDSRVEDGELVEVAFEAPVRTEDGENIATFTLWIGVVKTRTEAIHPGYVTGLIIPMPRPWERPPGTGPYSLFISQMLVVGDELSYGCSYDGDHGQPRLLGNKITQICVHHRPQR